MIRDVACLPPRSVAALRRRLNAWFDRERRPLPWRDVDDPYKVWVSEIMLQQTRVDTVWPYYERWLQRFPTVQSLAEASMDDVLRRWSGLGYYTRARNLHRAARTIMADHGGRLPEGGEALRRLPGVGAYTAGAVASIAFGRPEPAVDGNALRVLARISGERESIERTATKRRLTELAKRLVDPERPGEWNQAIMELGATHCKPRGPDCPSCPVGRWCLARDRGLTQKIPQVKPKPRVGIQRVHFAVVKQDGRILLTQRPDEGLLGGTWGLPGGPSTTPLGRAVREQTGIRVRKGRPLGRAEHRFTHRHWVMEVYACSVQKNGEAPVGGAITHWVQPGELADAPLAKATRKALAAAALA